MLQAKLAAEAAVVRRQIYASLPFTVRLAHFWLRLSYSNADMLGALAYSIFLAQGVEGMAPIKGMDALEFAKAKGIKGPRNINKLPRGTGAEFGRRAIGVALSGLASELKGTGAMDDIVAKVAERLLMGKYKIPKGLPLKRAESYIIKILQNETMDANRATTRQQQRHVTPKEDDDKALDFSNPNELLDVAHELTSDELRRIFRDIAQIGKDERGVDIVRLILKGYKDAEIARELGVSQVAIKKWLDRNNNRLRDIIGPYLL